MPAGAVAVDAGDGDAALAPQSPARPSLMRKMSAKVFGDAAAGAAPPSPAPRPSLMRRMSKQVFGDADAADADAATPSPATPKPTMLRRMSSKLLGESPAAPPSEPDGGGAAAAARPSLVRRMSSKLFGESAQEPAPRENSFDDFDVPVAATLPPAGGAASPVSAGAKGSEAQRKSAALHTFLQLMGVTPDRAAAEGVKGAAAGVHARDRLQPQLRARPAVSFAAKQDGQLDDAERERALRETRRRILESTESFARAIEEREAEERRRRAKPDALEREATRWHTDGRQAVEVATGQGTAVVEFEVFTTTDLSKEKRAAPKKRALWKPGNSKAKKKDRKETRAAPFDLSTSVDRFHAMEQRLRERALFRATWNFLDDIEMEFAATLLLQSWARRAVLYSRQPPPRACRMSVTSLAKALVVAAKAEVRVVDGKKAYVVAPPPQAEFADVVIRRFGRQRATAAPAPPRLALPTSTSPAPPAEPAAAPAPVVDAPPPADDDAPSSPRAFVHGLAREALARLLLDAPDGVFKDRRSGFAFAQDYPLGPREAEGGDAPPFSLAESRQKMAADWVLMMHVAAARLPAPFSELTGLLGDAGWTAPNDAWQEVVRGLFSDEVLSVSQNKAGDIYEVWF